MPDTALKPSDDTEQGHQDYKNWLNETTRQQETEARLVQTIKTLIEKGEKAKQKAEDFFIAAGQYLKTLHDIHKGRGGTWPEWEILVKEKCGIGKSRASELMLIADGRKTVEQVSANTTARSQKRRAASPLRNGEARALATLPVAEAPDEPDLHDDPHGGHHDVVNDADVDDEPGDDEQTIWRRGLMNRAGAAIEGAAYEDWSGFKIDQQLVETVREAADAWAELAAYLEKEKRRRKPKAATHKDTLVDAVAAVFEELSELGSEYREAVDNAPENLTESEINQIKAATADVLEELREPEVPAALADIEIVYTTTLSARKNRAPSRATRAANAFGIVAACTEVLEAIPETDDRAAAAAELLAELAQVTEAESCEFPGR